jgi:hypothetical protein
MIRVVHLGSGSPIRILILYSSRIPGSKRHRIPDPDPQHWYKVQTYIFYNILHLAHYPFAVFWHGVSCVGGRGKGGGGQDVKPIWGFTDLLFLPGRGLTTSRNNTQREIQGPCRHPPYFNRFRFLLTHVSPVLWTRKDFFWIRIPLFSSFRIQIRISFRILHEFF